MLGGWVILELGISWGGERETAWQEIFAGRYLTVAEFESLFKSNKVVYSTVHTQRKLLQLAI